MGETFLININCSKVLGESDETRYTMFIDSSKMSIVYELVEWIRWMFSFETCFYLTYNNSVIHELEDIQVLSRLQNFDIKPCGKANCVHKKMYRTLLKNLNLFVSWNGVEVHKYFLHKLNQMDQKLTQENNKATPRASSPGTTDPLNFLGYKSTKFDNNKNISPDSGKFFLSEDNLPKGSKESVSPVKKRTLSSKFETVWGANNESTNEINFCFDKKMTSNENLSSSEDKFGCSKEQTSEHLTLETKKSIKANQISVSPIKNKLKTDQDSGKNSAKSNTKKYVKPFSLGEILSSIREDFEKQKAEQKMKKNSPSPSPALSKGDFDIEENLFPTEIKKSEGRKRQRTRRRRKAKKENLDEEFVSKFLDNTAECSLDMVNSHSSLKPNHIRFDSDEENLMETECGDGDLKMENQNKYENLSRSLNDSSGLFPSEPKDLVIMTDNTVHLSDNLNADSEVNNSENKMDCSGVSQFASQEKLIDLDDQGSDNVSKVYNTHENFESKTLNPDLNMLLSLKEKFRNAVVIERFY